MRLLNVYVCPMRPLSVAGEISPQKELPLKTMNREDMKVPRLELFSKPSIKTGAPHRHRDMELPISLGNRVEDTEEGPTTKP